MNSKVKLRMLIAKGFRGARKEIGLDFTSSAKSLVLFGNNGDGKSTFSDAIEWFFTDKIDYLQREGCGRDDYFFKYMPPDDATVQISFNRGMLDSSKILKRKGGHSFSNVSADFQRYIKNSLKDSPILRHHTMREFVDKTKTKKLEKVEEIIGFGIVREIRDTLLKTLNALKEDVQLASLRGQLQEKERDLRNITGEIGFQNADILKYAHRLTEQCDPALSIISDFDFKSAIETLDKKVKASDRGIELSLLDSINGNVSHLPEIREILREVTDIIEQHNKLAKKEETIKASAVEKLYKAAVDVLENNMVVPGKCPICKQPTDTELLLKSLRSEIEEIEKVLKERKSIIQKAEIASSKLSSYQNIPNVLLQLEDEVKEKILTPETVNRLAEISTFLSQHSEILTRAQRSPEAVSLPPLLHDWQILEKLMKETQQRIANRKKDLSETDEEKKFYENVHKLKNLYDDYIRYKEINRHIGIYNMQVDSLSKIYQDFEYMERESVQKVLKTISLDVNDFLKFLHPGDNFDEVELVLTKERGIEFKMKYHGEEISPPMKILSEAHLNSLGICLFLASAKHFNKTNGFLVLDDVVASFDTEHRRPLARLLSEKFPDTQFLIFTHDELWFEMLKKDLPSGDWAFKELMKWTKENGLDLKDSPITLRERIRNCLNANDSQGAANKCRILIEETLKEKCEGLAVKGLEFRTGPKNDQRDASDLINALASYLKHNQTLRDKKSKKMFEHLRASQLITNMGSHHKTLETTTLSRGDIEMVLRDVDEFESLFVCTDCNTKPSIKYSPRNSDIKQCKCGMLWI